MVLFCSSDESKGWSSFFANGLISLCEGLQFCECRLNTFDGGKANEHLYENILKLGM